MDTRHANKNWALPTNADGAIETWTHVQIAVLMDIRNELRTLNRLLHCHNFQQIPTTLRAIHTKIPTRPKRKKK